MKSKLSKSETYTDFATKARMVRVAKRMTQQDFAEAFDVTPFAVRMWEGGQNIPRKDIRTQIDTEFEKLYFDIKGAELEKGKPGEDYRNCLRLISVLPTCCLISLYKSIAILLNAKTKDKWSGSPTAW